MNPDTAGGFWQPAGWPAPAAIRAGNTTRAGGVSAAPYRSLNLAAHVGDDPERVQENRRRLRAELALPEEPAWLEQRHGTRVIDLARDPDWVADGGYCTAANRVCAVLTADCVPLLLCDRQATEVAAVHIGWRGLAAGIVAAALRRFRSAPAELLAWIGPRIGPDHYPVGADVRDACLGADPALETAFTAAERGKWRADLGMMVRRRLEAGGVTRIHAAPGDTGAEPERYFSYRRERRTGRIASLIWIAGQQG